MSSLGDGVAADAGRAWSYRPGDWFAVLGSAAAVLVPADERSMVPALWAAVDDGAGFDALRGLLAGDGAGPGSACVLLGLDGPDHGPARLRAIVRGPASLEVEDSRGRIPTVLGGSGPDDGLEQDLGAQVFSVHVSLGEPRPGRAAPASWGTTVGTALVRASAVRWPAGSPPAASADPGARHETDHDGLTRSGEPGPPGRRPVARLVFSSGDLVDVDRPVLVGRAPEATQAPGSGEPRLVRVPSVQHEISSTHLEVRPGSGVDEGSAVVTDLGSTNGTVLVQPGFDPEHLQPGVSVQLHAGAVVDLGDGVTIQVARP